LRPAGSVQQVPYRIHERQDARRNCQQLLAQLAAIHFRFAQPAAQRVVVGQQPLDLGFQRVCVLQVVNPDGPAANLVFIGRADTAAGGADLALARSRFAHAIQLAVQRQDQHGVFGDAQVVRRDLHILGLQPVDLVGQRPRIDHHAIADERLLARPHNAGRQQGQLVGHPVDDQRVAGIVTTLKARHHIGALRQPVDDLALALVAPLGANHNHVCHHEYPVRTGSRKSERPCPHVVQEGPLQVCNRIRGF
jgi:hypothetical protein